MPGGHEWESHWLRAHSWERLVREKRVVGNEPVKAQYPRSLGRAREGSGKRRGGEAERIAESQIDTHISAEPEFHSRVSSGSKRLREGEPYKDRDGNVGV